VTTVMDHVPSRPGPTLLCPGRDQRVSVAEVMGRSCSQGKEPPSVRRWTGCSATHRKRGEDRICGRGRPFKDSKKTGGCRTRPRNNLAFRYRRRTTRTVAHRFGRVRKSIHRITEPHSPLHVPRRQPPVPDTWLEQHAGCMPRGLLIVSICGFGGLRFYNNR